MQTTKEIVQMFAILVATALCSIIVILLLLGGGSFGGSVLPRMELNGTALHLLVSYSPKVIYPMLSPVFAFVPSSSLGGSR